MRGILDFDRIKISFYDLFILSLFVLCTMDQLSWWFMLFTITWFRPYIVLGNTTESIRRISNHAKSEKLMREEKK